MLSDRVKDIQASGIRKIFELVASMPDPIEAWAKVELAAEPSGSDAAVGIVTELQEGEEP